MNPLRLCLPSLFLLPPLAFSMLADKLNMTPEEAERWIVNLIRNARLDAKIDSKLVSTSWVYHWLVRANDKHVGSYWGHSLTSGLEPCEQSGSNCRFAIY